MTDDLDQQTETSLASRLAADVLAAHHGQIDQPVLNEAKRTLLNVVGTSIGASGHPIVDGILEASRAGADGAVSIPGRSARVNPYLAALVIGSAAHVDDFDDTHLQTVIHPGASTLGAAWASASTNDVSGARFLSAFALGCEAQLRLGVSVSPEHYDNGWHITGTCGVVGAAVTAGLLAGLGDEDLAVAIAIAANATLGHREGFGTEAKAFHAGKAAANGILAVTFAPGSSVHHDGVLEPPRGLIGVLARDSDAAKLLTDFGQRWELLSNTYKPYPCGIVAHPGIDAAIGLHARVEHGRIRKIEYSCHPLVPELMGNLQPTDGLEARFSAVHGVAVGLITGKAGLHEFETDQVRDLEATRLRGLTQLLPRDDINRDEAAVTVVLDDGSRVSNHVEHARGSLARPLTDTELVDKATALIEPILDSAGPVIEAVGAIEYADSIGDLVNAATRKVAVER